MDEALTKIQEVSTGVTIHMEGYKMSGSTTHIPRSMQAGPSYIHPDRCPQMEENYYYESSLSTQEDPRQHYGLHRGDGSDSEEDRNVPEDTPPGPPPPGSPGPPPPGPPDPHPPGTPGPPQQGTSGRMRRRA